MPKGILKPQCEPDGPGGVPRKKGAQKVQWDPKSGEAQVSGF